jgi:glycosyltransferase involved in cell wall biosynthesis
MISFIIPAHNEQACLGRTLQVIHDVVRVIGRTSEVIVVDDASTDATAEIARQNNARVISVHHRQIAATRNSGARAARGDQLFFVDADTIINPRAVASALRAMDNGAVGGGAPTWLGKDEIVPLYARLVFLLLMVWSKLLGFTGGAFMFCTREAFCASGGFNERFYCSEESAFALALKREGRFAVLWRPVLTSGRRFRTVSGTQLLNLAVRAVVSPRKFVTERSSVEKIWYDSNRTNDDKVRNSLGARISNGIAFLVVVVLLTGPLWNFVPRAWTPGSSPLGKIRLVIGILLCHVGLMFWPLALILFINLLRQRRWTGLIQSVALIALFLWQAWGATEGVIWFWPWLFRGLTNFYKG